MREEHYFSRRPSARGGRRTFTARLCGRELRLTTEAGVFSRSRVDPGTRLLIDQMEIRPGDHVLDLGCGYGVVGIAAALQAPEGHVTLVDVNERAVALAQENVRRNAIENADVRHGDGFRPVIGETFDVIALNPPIRAGQATVHRLIDGALHHLRPEGRFYLVGRTRQGVVRLAAKMAQVHGRTQELGKRGGYRVYLASRAGTE